VKEVREHDALYGVMLFFFDFAADAAIFSAVSR
jgi:hypothetical protein